MSQCVPSWDIDDPPPNPSPILHLHHYHPSGAPLYPLHSRTDYEVAELTWENGQLALHGLVPPRIGKPTPKYPPPSVVSAAAAWNKHHRSGTLESVVNQATGAAPLATPDLEEWFGGTRRSAAVDALVPCKDDVANNPDYPAAATGRKRARVAGVCSSQGSVAGSLAGRVDITTLVTLGTCREDEIDLTTTATTATATISASPETETENTRVGKRKARALDDHVSISHTSSQSKHDSFYDEEEKATKRDAEKPCSSTKKSRAAAIHNQSERKRRDKINQRMKTLQKLVPSSSKSDKASMLDEVIEHLKQLQAQVQMMSRMNNMMMPMAMPQLQMPMMPHMAHVTQLPQMAMGMGMGMGMMDPISISRSMPTALPLLHPFAFLPLPGAWDCSGDRRPSAAALPDPYSTLLACQMAQQQPMSLDEYSRMASLCQQLYQHQPQAKANPKS